MKTISVATFNTVSPAQRLQRRLQQAGFPTVIEDESKLERFWFMSEPLAAIHVEVEQSKYLAARKLLAELESEGLMRDAVRCPDCGSSRVEFPQITRKFFLPVLEAVVMALHIIPRKFYCRDCHYTWLKSRPPEPARGDLA